MALAVAQVVRCYGPVDGTLERVVVVAARPVSVWLDLVGLGGVPVRHRLAVGVNDFAVPVAEWSFDRALLAVGEPGGQQAEMF